MDETFSPKEDQISTVAVAQNTTLGSIVVGPTGLTLYRLISETKGTVSCLGACAVQWPPLVVKAGVKLVAGPGLTALKLGTVRRPDGKIQVAYGGFALYRFASDKKPGQANGQGLESVWFAVMPTGKVTKTAIAPSALLLRRSARSRPSRATGAPTTEKGSATGRGARGSPAGRSGPTSLPASRHRRSWESASRSARGTR